MEVLYGKKRINIIIFKNEAQNDNTYIIALGPLTFEQWTWIEFSEKYLKSNSDSFYHAMFQESLWEDQFEWTN